MRAAIFVGLVLLVGGCSSKQETVLGKRPTDGKFVQVSALAPGSLVTVKGVIVEKCPVAGCWFMLRDKSGVIRVDTKSSGFVVLDVPLNTTVKVSGTLKTAGERMIAATGMSY
jgi:uncharacterized protein YdeI (BOF family)